MNRREFLKFVAGAVAGLFAGRVAKAEAKDRPWTHIPPGKREETVIPSLPGCELSPGPVPDVNIHGWLRLIQNPSWGDSGLIELDARAEEGIRVDGVGIKTAPWSGQGRIRFPTYIKPLVSWSFPKFEMVHKPDGVREISKTEEGWTIIFWRDDVPYSIIMVKGAAIPRFCRDGDDLAWTNWGLEQDDWLAEKKEFANWAMEEQRWVVDCDFKGRYDGYIFLPHMVSLLGTWPNDQLWDMHLFWRGDWFWVQYERRKPGLEA